MSETNQCLQDDERHEGLRRSDAAIRNSALAEAAKVVQAYTNEMVPGSYSHEDGLALTDQILALRGKTVGDFAREIAPGMTIGEGIDSDFNACQFRSVCRKMKSKLCAP
jgi:hypothetical protein